MDCINDIENARHTNFIDKIIGELDYLTNLKPTNIFANGSDIDISNRIQILQSLANVQIKPTNTLQQQKDNMFKEIEKYVYRKMWNKLTGFHKVIKLKEYFNENVNDEKTRDELIEKFTKYAEHGMINTKKFVIYDPNTEKILSMPCLLIDDEKNTYKLKYLE